MSVALELRIPREGITLGRALSSGSWRRVELERIVPVGSETPLFIWVVGADGASLRDEVDDHPAVTASAVVEERSDRVLYRIHLAGAGGTFLESVGSTDAVVLEAICDREWRFRLRFPDHDRLSQFHDACADDVPMQIERIDPLRADGSSSGSSELSQPQYEALELALERGYFSTPSETTLSELADELDITHQALSSRIRRGTEAVLETEIGSEVDWE